jgi:hypothetical protein
MYYLSSLNIGNPKLKQLMLKKHDMKDTLVWTGIMHGWQQDTLENIKKKDIF